MPIAGCRVWFLMHRPYRTLYSQRLGLRIVGKLLILCSFCILLLWLYTCCLELCNGWAPTVDSNIRMSLSVHLCVQASHSHLCIHWLQVSQITSSNIRKDFACFPTHASFPDECSYTRTNWNNISSLIWIKDSSPLSQLHCFIMPLFHSSRSESR